jgi:hypothetical protein
MFKLISEADEMYKICSVIGTPDRETWPDGLRLAESLNFQFPVCEKANLFQLIPSASEEAVNLISVFLLFFFSSSYTVMYCSDGEKCNMSMMMFNAVALFVGPK